jgi:hypothetical protein
MLKYNKNNGELKVHSFKIEINIIRRIKELCAKLGIPMAKFVNDALLEKLNKYK